MHCTARHGASPRASRWGTQSARSATRTCGCRLIDCGLRVLIDVHHCTMSVALPGAARAQAMLACGCRFTSCCPPACVVWCVQCVRSATQLPPTCTTTKVAPQPAGLRGDSHAPKATPLWLDRHPPMPTCTYPASPAAWRVARLCPCPLKWWSGCMETQPSCASCSCQVSGWALLLSPRSGVAAAGGAQLLRLSSGHARAAGVWSLRRAWACQLNAN